MATFKQRLEESNLLDSFKTFFESTDNIALTSQIIYIYGSFENFINTDLEELDPRTKDRIESTISNKLFKRHLKEILNNENQ